jgi:hypothetical protein
LERDGRHDLAAAIREDRVSAYSIAVSLGWTKRAEPVGTSISSTNAAKRRQYQLRALTGEGLSAGQMMELQYGPSPSTGSYFASREELSAAWEQVREHLLEGCRPGHRVAAWWEFEAPALGLAWPGHSCETSYLHDAGVLGDEEKAELLAFWREEFGRAYDDPDFSYITAPGEILHGMAARKAHLDWADVPHSLRRRWSAAHRRRRAQQGDSSGAQSASLNAPTALSEEAASIE